MTGKELFDKFEPHDVRFDTHVITGTLKRSVEMSDWNADKRLFTNKHTVLKGALVRIVMRSRMGDLGITDNMTQDQGYGVRVMPEHLGDVKIKAKE